MPTEKETQEKQEQQSADRDKKEQTGQPKKKDQESSADSAHGQMRPLYSDPQEGGQAPPAAFMRGGTLQVGADNREVPRYKSAEPFAPRIDPNKKPPTITYPAVTRAMTPNELIGGGAAGHLVQAVEEHHGGEGEGEEKKGGGETSKEHKPGQGQQESGKEHEKQPGQEHEQQRGGYQPGGPGTRPRSEVQ